MTSFTFTVDPNSFEVFIYSSEHSEAIVYQPHQPDMSDWESATQAQDWATTLISQFEADQAPAEIPAP